MACEKFRPDPSACLALAASRSRWAWDLETSFTAVFFVLANLALQSFADAEQARD